MKNRIPFGPIPSRRLGRSLGINNIPPKICTYSCLYCQVGETCEFTVKRRNFYQPEKIKKQVLTKISELRKHKEKIDYLSFVPDGEPTLDINLGEEIELLKDTGIPIAVITNSSLIAQPDVRKDLNKANWVSLKIDAYSEEIWEKVNRPHPDLSLNNILEGITEFSNEYRGDLHTETMLIKEINTEIKHIEKIADFIGKLKINKAYISIPTRPSTLKWIKQPTEEITNIAYSLFKEKGINVELLTGYPPTKFAKTDNVRDEILDITSVHPMREEDLSDILDKADKDWEIVEKLLNEKEIKMVKFNKNKFYIRCFKRETANG